MSAEQRASSSPLRKRESVESRIVGIDEAASRGHNFLRCVVPDDLFIARFSIDNKVWKLAEYAKENRLKIKQSHLAMARSGKSKDEIFPPRGSPLPSGQNRARRSAIDARGVLTTPQCCPVCNGRLLRVVTSYDNPSRRLLECMRKSCLASVDYTNLPAGQVIGVDEETYGWYDGNLEKIFYPKSSFTPNYKFGDFPVLNPDSVKRDDAGYMLIRCPGQKQPVRLI